MGRFFDLDSPLMKFLNKMTDLLVLNLIVILLCIPVITAGAAFTAMHFVVLRMVRGEEGYITKDFFRSFKLNFKQATAIWLMILAIAILLIADVRFMLDPNLSTVVPPMWILVGVGIAAILLIMTSLLVFPVLSRFTNTIRGTIKNAFLLSITILPKTLLMFLVTVAPAVLFSLAAIAQPICFLFFFSVPAYVSAMLYNSAFKKYEPEKEENNDDYSWSVLMDEVASIDEAISADEAVSEEDGKTDNNN